MSFTRAWPQQILPRGGSIFTATGTATPCHHQHHCHHHCQAASSMEQSRAGSWHCTAPSKQQGSPAAQLFPGLATAHDPTAAFRHRQQCWGAASPAAGEPGGDAGPAALQGAGSHPLCSGPSHFPVHPRPAPAAAGRGARANPALAELRQGYGSLPA